VRHTSVSLAIVCATCILLSRAPTAHGQYTFTTLAYFNYNVGEGAASPEGPLVEDPEGNLYGTAYDGGLNGYGAVFQIVAQTHTVSSLQSFDGSNGAWPEQSGLIVAPDGNYYGTTSNGGKGWGTVFQVAADTHAVTTLALFTQDTGFSPQEALVADASGNLYGATSRGPINSGTDDGTLFEVAAGTNTVTTLVTFNGANGTRPRGLVDDANGNLYGVVGNLSTNTSTIFELPAGTRTIKPLVTFNGASSGGTSRLSIDAHGNLYGTTSGGGAYGYGTIFEVTDDTHRLTTLASFDTDELPNADSGLFADTSGNLYGTRAGGVPTESGYYGSVFELPAGTNKIINLHTFDYSDGAYPISELMIDSYGNLYGTTDGGGMNNYGTAFELSPVPEPSALTSGLYALACCCLLYRMRLAAF
jgi:uncharacterized repeat protein (TIGR03803 family)